MSYENGLDGVVCSTFESRAIKNATSERLSDTLSRYSDRSGKMRETSSVWRHLELGGNEEGVDYPVVGRPIYKDADPRKKVEEILKVMSGL